MRPQIGTAGSAVLYGKSYGDIPALTNNQVGLKDCMHAPGLMHNLISVGSLCDSTGCFLVHSSKGAWVVDPKFIDVSKCLRIASRSDNTSKMYIAETKCFGFGTKAVAMLSLGSIVDDVSFCMLGNKALREQVCNLCLNTISYSALVTNENPAFTFHKRSGHPSRDTIKTILRKD